MGDRAERERKKHYKEKIMEILIIFRTRTQTVRCANMLSAAGYRANVTDAPLKLYGSCTLAVRTDREGFSYFARRAQTFSSFYGAFSSDGGKYTRIF